jgi:hypothetical protein
MILDILTVLFFVLGFALILWMVGERRRDVLHYVAKSGRRGDVRDDRLDRVAARGRQSSVKPSMSNVADELSRIVRDIERDTNSSESSEGEGEIVRLRPERH